MSAIFNIGKNEIIIIYNPDKFRDREALGYVKSIKDYSVKEIDVTKDQITEQQYMDLTYRLKIQPIDLFDRHSDLYKKNYKGVKLTRGDIIKAVKQTPSLLNTPIVVYHDNAYFVKSPYDFVKKGMNVKGINPEIDKLNKED
jgi:arsenate reductase-like glutaredoxin family protein